MPSDIDRTKPEAHRATPDPRSNAFAGEFLEQFRRRPEAATAAEAELAGPWEVSEVTGGWGVFRVGEAPGSSLGRSPGPEDEPEAVFEHREHALLLVAVLAAVGREPLFHLDPTERAEGYSLETVWGDAWVRSVGRLRRFQPEIAEALHVAESLVRSPAALASLLEAAGATALEIAGTQLRRRLEEEEIT
jgi:hypothetical protein